MPPPLPTALNDLLDTLEQRAARVVMPTAAAAAFVRRQFARRQAQRGRTVWTQPDVLAWPQWTSSLWTEAILAGHDDRMLLNGLQEEALWRDIITDAPVPGLTPAASQARLAQSGWSLAATFLATHRLRRSAGTPDTRTFAAWAEQFRSRCAQERVLPAAELEAALEQHIGEGRLRVPERLLICAPVALTPAQQALLEALERSGTHIDQVRLTAPQDSPDRSSAILPDEHEELRFALRAVRTFLTSHPEARAALLVPDLAGELSTLEPLLFELLAPELTPVAADASSAPWEMAGSQPLAQMPAVAAILELARWAQGALPLDRIEALLLSPHLCPANQRDRRARFVAEKLLRQSLLRPELELAPMLRLARVSDPGLGAWLGNILEIAARMSAAPPRRSFADWTQALRELARAAEWPGERPLTAAELSATEAYDALLDLVSTLDFLGKRVTFSEAFEAVQTQAARTAAPAVSTGAPLQILSPQQAEGLTFDFTVLLRATDANLPASAHAHPLLDWALQRDLRMPGAHPSADDERARDAFAAILAGSTTILATSAAQNTEGALRPSPLLGSNAFFCPTDPATYLEPEAATAPIPEWLVDDSAPLPPLPSATATGGARLLKLQAACGFLAFAELRLGGRELETAEPGFDAVESGNVLHSALQAFWGAVETQDALRRMSPADRDAALIQAIDAAATEHKLMPDSPWDLAYLAVQKERMRRLLTRWLDFELERGPFTVVAMEKQETVEVGPLALKVRIDRIDAVPDGHVLVDYKTGLGAKPAAWEGDRPDEPQLPLYSLLGEEGELRAMAFARVRAGRDMAWAGHAAEAGILPQKRPIQVDLDLHRDEWRRVLTHLAQDFHDGKADVQPKNPAVNCRRCAQRLLCRVEMASLMVQPADNTPEDSGE